MLQVLSNTWALLLGMFLLMIGNGLQGTLLGVRGEIEGPRRGTKLYHLDNPCPEINGNKKH